MDLARLSVPTLDYFEDFLGNENLTDDDCFRLLDIVNAHDINDLDRLVPLVCVIKAKSIVGLTTGVAELCEQACQLVGSDSPQLAMLNLFRAMSDHEIRMMSTVSVGALVKFETMARTSHAREYSFDARFLRLRISMGDTSKEFIEQELEVCANFFKEKKMWLRLAMVRNSQFLHFNGSSDQSDPEKAHRYALLALRAARKGRLVHHYALTLVNLADALISAGALQRAERVLARVIRHIRKHRISRDSIAFALYLSNRAYLFTMRGNRRRYVAQYYRGIRAARRVENNLLAFNVHKEFTERTEALGDTAELIEAHKAMAEFQQQLSRLRLDQARKSVQLSELISKNETHWVRRGMAVGANVDPLTQLNSRAALDDHLKAFCQLEGQRVLAFIDLNDFKEINDSLSHFAGDAALRIFASRLVQQIGDIGTVYRWGGDEFFFVSSDQIAPELVRKRLATCQVIVGSDWTHDSITSRLSARVGTVEYPRDARDPATLTRYAAIALREAKKSQTHLEHYKAAHLAHMDRYFRIKRELRNAVIADAFTVHFQPIVRLSDCQVVGSEALSRWQMFGHIAVSPQEFMPVLIGLRRERDLVAFLLAESIKHLSRADSTSDVQPYVSINISPSLFCDEDFAELVFQELSPHSDDYRQRLVLEVLESEILDQSIAAQHNAQQLQAAGIRLAIDDFGAGFSTLEQLAKLPFDILKIDKSFGLKLAEDRMTEIIFKNMVRLAEDTEKSVIAEGIETQAQFDKARALGACYGQGFLFDRLPLRH
ncbi:MAG: GGDEF and EAL domain-containing protein [Gammaproteobacteria bacterium]|nr:GGDEF and EAL domain-containing protein [Gammaproteobacteria bacterium]